MQKKAIVQECEKYKAQLEKSGTKYKILSEKTMKMVLFFQEFVVKMWSNQEKRVRKQVKNPCEARKIKASQNLHKKISTHILTVLTIWCITQIVNGKRYK